MSANTSRVQQRENNTQGFMVSAMRVFGQLGWNYLLNTQSFFYYLSNWIDWSLLTRFCKTENSHQPLSSPQEKAQACGLLGVSVEV